MEPERTRTDPERTLNGPGGRFDLGVGLRVPKLRGFGCDHGQLLGSASSAIRLASSPATPGQQLEQSLIDYLIYHLQQKTNEKPNSKTLRDGLPLEHG